MSALNLSHVVLLCYCNQQCLIHSKAFSLIFSQHIFLMKIDQCYLYLPRLI